MERMNFDYIYGRESEAYNFYAVPKFLIHNIELAELSLDAKLVYAVLLNRVGLSKENGWIDEENRVYIIFTIEEMISEFNLGAEKAVKMLKDLEAFGLIEKKRQGQGKPNLIYVKNAAVSCKKVGDFQNSENPNSRISKNRIQEFGKSESSNNNYNYNNNIYITQSKNFNNYNKKIKQNGVIEGESEGLDQDSKACDFIYQKINDNYTETVNQGNTSYELLKVIADKVKNDSEMIETQGKFIQKSRVLEKLNKYFNNYEAWLDVLDRITDIDKKRGIKNKYKFILTMLYEETILPNSSKRKRQFENNQKSEEEIEEFLKILNTGNDILKYIKADANEEVQ